MNVIYYLLIIVFLVLGILNPVKGNRVDEFVAYFLFCFVAIVVFSPNRFENIKKLAIGVIILGFLTSSFATSKDLRKMLSSDLPLYTYNNDPGAFLKVYQLLEGNVYYYEAIKIAHIGRFAQRTAPTDIWGIRLPTIFFIWKVLPGNGLSIYFLYLFLACSVLFVAYKIGERYLGSGTGILSAYLLFPYLHFAGRDQMVLETEWWAVLVFILALFFLIKKKLFWATVLFSLAVMIRELYLMPLLLFLVYYLFKDRKVLFVFLVSITSFVVLFLFHLIFASQYIDSWGTLFRPRVVPFGLLLTKQALAFASWEYLFFGLRPFLIFLLMALVGCLGVWQKVKKEEGLLLLISFLVFPVAFLKIGTVPFNDYWGIMYMPQVLIFAPIVLVFFGKKLSTKV